MAGARRECTFWRTPYGSNAVLKSPRDCTMFGSSMRRVGLIDITVGNATRLGASQRSAKRRCASHHIATQRLSRWGSPAARAFSADGLPSSAPVAPRRSCESKYMRAESWRTFQSTRTRRRREQYMPLVAFCLSHFLADSIICMCECDFRQAQACGGGDNEKLIFARFSESLNFRLFRQHRPEADVPRGRRSQQGHPPSPRTGARFAPGPATSYRRHLAGVLGGKGLVSLQRQGELKDGAARFIRAGP